MVERRNRFSDDSGLPRVEYEDIVPGQGMLNKDVAKKHDQRGGIAFRSDDVLYGKLRPYLQNWLNPQFDGIALGDFWVLNPTSITSRFLFNLIQTPAFERVANESTGTKMPRADWQNVSNAEFAIPSSREEQEKIGTFFRSLDHFITLHQRKRNPRPKGRPHEKAPETKCIRKARRIGLFWVLAEASHRYCFNIVSRLPRRRSLFIFRLHNVEERLFCLMPLS